jgi:hypothetical protein
MTRDPTLNDFYNDMNEHAQADYKRVNDRLVVELDSMPTGWWLTVWEAIKQGGEYVDPDNPDNNYHWDAVGRGTFEDYKTGRAKFNSLTTRKEVQMFCEKNPYDGPRTPYDERDD